MAFFILMLEGFSREALCRFIKFDHNLILILSHCWRGLLKSSLEMEPVSTNRYNSMLPSVYVSPLKLHSATKINLHGVSESALFRNLLKVRLSPLKSPVLRNSRSKYRRSVVYPSISKCNAKRCSCCKHLCCKSTIKSNVNGRQFSEITNSDLD